MRIVPACIQGWYRRHCSAGRCRASGDAGHRAMQGGVLHCIDSAVLSCRHPAHPRSPPMSQSDRATPAASKPPIAGTCDPRFEAVRAAFVSNLAEDLEVGASFCAAVEGKPVVDLWGGWRDARRERPWERDTLVCVWSTTKVMTAACTWMLAARGAIDLDAPVARYWP